MSDVVVMDGRRVVVPALDTRGCPSRGACARVEADVLCACRDMPAQERVPMEAAWVHRHENVRVACKEHPALRVATKSVDFIVPLLEEGLLIGRDQSCDVVLHDHAVSRRHVHILPEGDGALVRDEGATNPALLRGEAVRDVMRMACGEELDVCGATFTLL